MWWRRRRCIHHHCTRGTAANVCRLSIWGTATNIDLSHKLINGPR